MSTLHPPLTRRPSSGRKGIQAEYDVLSALELGLPPGFDVFHNIDWSTMHDGEQDYGELDAAVLSPAGDLALLEVKSGSVEVADGKLVKLYGSQGNAHIRNVGLQARRQHSAILSRLTEAGLAGTRLAHFLVLTDHMVQSDIVAYPRDRIIDSVDMPNLCTRVQRAFSSLATKPVSRDAVFSFLANQYRLLIDVDAQDKTAQRATRQLSDGLATWVPRIESDHGFYLIEATAGSGKTQLALQLLSDACLRNQRATYICYNRSLADHMIRMLPAAVRVSTFHEWCADFSRARGIVPDFKAPGVFDQIAQHLLDHAQDQAQDLDMLVVDEYQDLQGDWVLALMQRLVPQGRAYVLGDSDQRVGGYEAFDLGGCVRVTSMDNYRSPRQVVKVINELRLTHRPVESRSTVQGDFPGFHSYSEDGRPEIDRVVRSLLKSGYAPNQIALVSFAGKEKSQLLRMSSVADLPLRKPTGQYDTASNALWTDGVLLADTVGRFKGQSAPVVVLTDIDFEVIDERVLHKLFVGFTRARLRLECVMSDRAQNLLGERLQGSGL